MGCGPPDGEPELYEPAECVCAMRMFC